MCEVMKNTVVTTERLDLELQKDAVRERSTCPLNPRVCQSSKSHLHMQVRASVKVTKERGNPKGKKEENTVGTKGSQLCLKVSLILKTQNCGKISRC